MKPVSTPLHTLCVLFCGGVFLLTAPQLSFAQTHPVSQQSPGDSIQPLPPIVDARPFPTPKPVPPGLDVTVDFSWNKTNNNIWGTSGNWTPAAPTGGPNAAGLYVVINTDITVDRTITLFNTGDPGTATKTIGRLDIGDQNGSNIFTIAAGTGNGVLNFDGNGANAQLNELSTSAGDTISAPITLNTSLDITNASANTLTLSGGITAAAGSDTITNSTGNVTISGVIGDGSGTVAVAQNGSGALTLTKANTFTGGFTLTNGTVNVGNNNALAAGVLTLNGGTIQSNNTAARSLANSQINITGDFTIGGTNTGLLSSSAPVTLTGVRQITDNNTSGATTFSGVISGVGGGITKAGPGALLLSGANTFDSGVTVNAGILQVGNSSNVGGGVMTSGPVGTGTLALNNGSTLSSGSGVNRTLENNLTLSGGVTIGDATNNGNVTFNSAGLTTAATITLLNNVTITNPSTVTLSNVISGNFSLTKTGAGTLTLGAANLFTGGTIINAGILAAGSNTALAGGALSFGAGSTGKFQLNGNNITVSDLNTDPTVGTPVIENGANGASKTLTVNTSNTDTYAGVLQDGAGTGTLGLTKSGSGTLTLTGANTYTGPTAVSVGTVGIGNDTAFGTSSLTLAGGTLTAVGGPHSISNVTSLGLGGGTIAGANDLTFTGSFTNSGGNRTLTVTNTGTTTFGTVNLSNDSTNRTLTITGSGNTVFGGVIQNGGGSTASNLTFDNSYAGTATINGTNTYSGTTTLTNGTFVLGNTSAFGTSGVTWGGVNVSASMDLSGANAIANIGTLAATNTFTGSNNIELSGTLTNTSNSGTIKNNISSGETLTLSGTLNLSNNANSRTVTFSGSGNTLVSGIIQNGGGSTSNITKSNGGTLTLTNTNTYTGTTTINAGVLDLNTTATTVGQLAGTSNITVNSGGTLMLSNSGNSSTTDRINDNATMTMNGGTFKTTGLSEHGATNNTPGIGALTLQSSSIINLGSGSSVIAFANSSAQTWTGTLSIYNWSGSTSGNGTDQVYFGNDNTGLNAGQLSDVTFYSDSGITALGVAQILADGEIVPVPEPATWFGAALTLAAVAYSQRRRFSRKSAAGS